MKMLLKDMTTRERNMFFLEEFARALAIYGSLALAMLVLYVLCVVDSYQ